jgi:AraC-like DNA-binding protein
VKPTRVLVVQPDHQREELLRPLDGLLERINNFRHGGIEMLARRVARELQAPDAAAPLAVEALVLDMLASAARADPGPNDTTDPPAWLERAREFVHARFLDAPRIADIAAAVDIHPAHLAAVFRRHYRIPLGTYVRRLRLEWSARCLLEDERSLSSIAFEAGFSDQSHFTRAFKSYSGQTPGEYRGSRERSAAIDERR